MGYTIEDRGLPGNTYAYVVGNLPEARADAEAAYGPLVVTFTEENGWHSADVAAGDHWGSGTTQEAALRYLLGSILNTHQGATR